MMLLSFLGVFSYCARLAFWTNNKASTARSRTRISPGLFRIHYCLDLARLQSPITVDVSRPWSYYPWWLNTGQTFFNFGSTPLDFSCALFVFFCIFFCVYRRSSERTWFERLSAEPSWRCFAQPFRLRRVVNGGDARNGPATCPFGLPPSQTQFMHRPWWRSTSLSFSRFYTLGESMWFSNMVIHLDLSLRSVAQGALPTLKRGRGAGQLLVAIVPRVWNQAIRDAMCHTFRVPRSVNTLRVCRHSSFCWKTLTAYPIYWRLIRS